MPRVDIHFHVLPGLDDGPATLDESIELARSAVRDWTSTVIATPHVRLDQVTDVAALPERVSELQDRLDADGVELSVCCGAKLGHEMVGWLSQTALDLVAVGPPGARWLLVEAPFGGFHENVHMATAELRERGFGVVIAHPERSTGILDHGAAAMRRELHAGSLLQVNAMSLAGHHGERAEQAAFWLVREGLVTALASDAHGGWRVPALSLGFEHLVGSGISAEVARRIADINPIELLTRGLTPRAPALAAAAA